MTRQLREVDERHRPARLRASRQAGHRQEDGRGSRGPQPATEARSFSLERSEMTISDFMTCYCNSVVLLISFRSSAGTFSHVYGRLVAYFSNHSISAFSLNS